MLYAAMLAAIAYHAFLTLFLDYSGTDNFLHFYWGWGGGVGGYITNKKTVCFEKEVFLKKKVCFLPL
jgi:hypothetical protein